MSIVYAHVVPGDPLELHNLLPYLATIGSFVAMYFWLFMGSVRAALKKLAKLFRSRR
jgi:hypothetical protein